MKSTHEESYPEDQHVDAVLAALGSASPEEGFERRIQFRLAQAAAPQRRSAWTEQIARPRFAWACGAIMAACLAAVVLAPRSSGPSQPMVPSGAQRASATPPFGETRHTQGANGTATAPEPGFTAANHHGIRCVGRTCVQGAPADRQAGTQLTIVRLDPAQPPRPQSSREASYPAPEMPLTEQERLLLQIAHRNDPIQVAMLDPVERDLQLARERAESAKFFAPEPLPAEMQQEINAALRSQYVNTPPPEELLAKSADRSNP